MKNLFSICFIFFCSLFFTATAAPSAASFNDCEGDYVSAKFDAKSNTLQITVTTQKPIDMKAFNRASIGWHFYTDTAHAATQVYDHLLQNENNTAYAAFSKSNSGDMVTVSAGISLTTDKLSAKRDGNNLSFSVILNKEQLAHLKGANALQTISMPKIWLYY
jgi:hypothetical protein